MHAARGRADEDGGHALTDRVTLAEVEFDALSEEATVAQAIGALESGSGGWILPVNLEVLRLATRSAETRELLAAADLVVADGQPLIWASRLQGTRLPDRVAGSNLIWSLTAAAARAGRSIFLLGGDPGAGEVAARRLREANPSLEVAGLYCPPYGFERDPEEGERIAGGVRAAAPDIVFVGLGFPRAGSPDPGVAPGLPAASFVSVGISVGFAAGHVRPRRAGSACSGSSGSPAGAGAAPAHLALSRPRRAVRRAASLVTEPADRRRRGRGISP